MTHLRDTVYLAMAIGLKSGLVVSTERCWYMMSSLITREASLQKTERWETGGVLNVVQEITNLCDGGERFSVSLCVSRKANEVKRSARPTCKPECNRGVI